MNSQDYSISQLKEFIQQGQQEVLMPSLAHDERKGAQVLYQRILTEQKKAEKQKEVFIQRSIYECQAKEKGYRYIAGIDEVGRGPLAGPVVAAAVILPDDCQLYELNDSKQLSEKKRNQLYDAILNEALGVGIGQCSCEEIDQYNIYQATKIAMQRAIGQLPQQPDYLLLDAMELPLDIPQESIIKGDAKSISIAAASIVAKVTRDRLMVQYSEQYPHYDFEHNMGYGTKNHLMGLEQYGCCPIHRRSFEPIKSRYQ